MSDKPFNNNLMPAEAERLALLAEECGEVIQAVTKILRHGYASYHPLDVNETPNRRHLETEIGHVVAAYHLMVDFDDLAGNEIERARARKLSEVGKYLHHQEGS